MSTSSSLLHPIYSIMSTSSSFFILFTPSCLPRPVSSSCLLHPVYYILFTASCLLYFVFFLSILYFVLLKSVLFSNPNLYSRKKSFILKKHEGRHLNLLFSQSFLTLLTNYTDHGKSKFTSSNCLPLTPFGNF